MYTPHPQVNIGVPNTPRRDILWYTQTHPNYLNGDYSHIFTGWWFGTWILWLSILIGNVIIPTVTHSIIFQRGGSTTRNDHRLLDHCQLSRTGMCICSLEHPGGLRGGRLSAFFLGVLKQRWLGYHKQVVSDCLWNSVKPNDHSTSDFANLSLSISRDHYT